MPPTIRRLSLRESTDIQAPPHSVRALFDDLESWPHWNAVCESAAWVAGEPWEPNSVFHMTLRMARRPVGFTVRVSESAHDAVAWESTVFSVTGRRRFTFAGLNGDSVTRVADHKTFSSPYLPVRLFYPRPIIQTMSRGWLASLKNHAERVALGER